MDFEESKLEIEVKITHDEPNTKKLKFSNNEINKTSISDEKSSTSDTKPSTSDEKSSTSVAKASISNEKPSTLDEKPSTSHAKPSTSDEKPSTSKFDLTTSVTKTNTEDNDKQKNKYTTEHEIPEKGFTYPLEMDSSDMLDEVEFDGENFPTVTERYFTPYYQLDTQKPGDDICILIHSNRVCMITIAPSHNILQENKTIEKCNYKVSEKLDRTKNKVSGKAKHGAQPLQSNSNLCILNCTDGSTYTIKCCMIGKLIEVNERLVENPELLKKEPHFGGYIAIILPNLKHLDSLKEKLLTQTQYEEAIKKRNEITENIKDHNQVTKMTTEENNELELVLNTENPKTNAKNVVKTTETIEDVITEQSMSETDKGDKNVENMEIVEP